MPVRGQMLHAHGEVITRRSEIDFSFFWFVLSDKLLFVVFFFFFLGGGVNQKNYRFKGGPCEKNWQAEGGHAIFKWCFPNPTSPPSLVKNERSLKNNGQIESNPISGNLARERKTGISSIGITSDVFLCFFLLSSSCQVILTNDQNWEMIGIIYRGITIEHVVLIAKQSRSGLRVISCDMIRNAAKRLAMVPFHPTTNN